MSFGAIYLILRFCVSLERSRLGFDEVGLCPHFGTKKKGLELFLEDLGEELAICGRRLETHHHFDNLNFFFLFSHV